MQAKIIITLSTPQKLGRKKNVQFHTLAWPHRLGYMCSQSLPWTFSVALGRRSVDPGSYSSSAVSPNICLQSSLWCISTEHKVFHRFLSSIGNGQVNMSTAYSESFSRYNWFHEWDCNIGPVTNVIQFNQSLLQ